MPVHKAYTQFENDREYTGKQAPISKYNWGYDSMNFFTIEGRYCTNPNDPEIRIFELQNLVRKLHEAGIGVIFDVVFNHVYMLETLENAAPGCYYRLNDNGTVSGHTGAGATLESRHKMVRKLMLDSLKYMIDTFSADGFRFDLMCFHDHETIIEIRKTLGLHYNSENPNDLLLHGEAWEFTDLPKYQAVTKLNLPEPNQTISVFNDVFRDALAGRNEEPGWIQGNYSQIHNLASGISGAVKSFSQVNIPFNSEQFFAPYSMFCKEPAECINYAAIHDGLTLWDKMRVTTRESKNIRLRFAKLSVSILFTSQGKITWHGGDEILRSKPLAAFDSESHRSIAAQNKEDAKRYHENSYQSPDFTNCIHWDRLTKKTADFAQEMLFHVQNFIKMRRLYPCFRFETSENISKGLCFIKPHVIPSNYPENSIISYILDNRLEFSSYTNSKTAQPDYIFVCHNASKAKLQIRRPEFLQEMILTTRFDGDKFNQDFFQHTNVETDSQCNEICSDNFIEIPEISTIIVAAYKKHCPEVKN
jgi:pullulanase